MIACNTADRLFGEAGDGMELIATAHSAWSPSAAGLPGWGGRLSGADLAEPLGAREEYDEDEEFEEEEGEDDDFFEDDEEDEFFEDDDEDDDDPFLDDLGDEDDDL